MNWIKNSFTAKKRVKEPTKSLSDRITSMSIQELRDEASLGRLDINWSTLTIKSINFNELEKAFFSFFEYLRRMISEIDPLEINELINKNISTDLSLLSAVRFFSELPGDTYILTLF